MNIKLSYNPVPSVVLTLLLGVLKLSRVFNISWWLVFLPVYGTLILFIIIALVVWFRTNKR